MLFFYLFSNRGYKQFIFIGLIIVKNYIKVYIAKLVLYKHFRKSAIYLICAYEADIG